jgi:MarR family transcriptional regulator, lower aerobic nicotinate degradation pathway regulator
LDERSSGRTVADYWMRPANLLRRAQRLSLALFSEECARHDISRSQFEALIAVSQFPGLDQISLARAFGIDRSTTAQVIDLLEERGMVVRSVHPTDRRKRVLELTEPGNAMLALVAAAARRAEPRLLQPLDDGEIDVLVGALNVLANMPSSAPDWTLDEDSATDRRRRKQFDYLTRRPAFLLRRSVQVSFALFADATADLDLTPTQFGLLYLMKVVQTDEATISRLAGVERSTSDRLLKRLSGRGYVERTTRRGHRVLRLTAEGDAIFEESRRRTAELDDRLMQALPVELRGPFVNALAKLLFVHGQAAVGV